MGEVRVNLRPWSRSRLWRTVGRQRPLSFNLLIEPRFLSPPPYHTFTISFRQDRFTISFRQYRLLSHILAKLDPLWCKRLLVLLIHCWRLCMMINMEGGRGAIRNPIVQKCISGKNGDCPRRPRPRCTSEARGSWYGARHPNSYNVKQQLRGCSWPGNCLL